MYLVHLLGHFKMNEIDLIISNTRTNNLISRSQQNVKMYVCYVLVCSKITGIIT